MKSAMDSGWPRRACVRTAPQALGGAYDRRDRRPLDVNGRIIGPGSYAHFPANSVMRHQAADEACHFVLVFHGPFDVTVVDGD